MVSYCVAVHIVAAVQVSVSSPPPMVLKNPVMQAETRESFALVQMYVAAPPGSVIVAALATAAQVAHTASFVAVPATST